MDMEKIRDTAKVLLYISPQIDEEFTFIVHHPFLDNYMCIKDKILNINDNLSEMQEFYMNKINEADLTRLFIYVKTPYHLLFLKLIKPYLTKDEFSGWLSYVWVNSENPNQDVNVSIKEVVKFFKDANKEKLMTTEDYEYYNNLPDTFEIYRGVAVGRNPKGISYTDDYEKANWFAHRFDTEDKQGYIITKAIKKSDVLAYFNTRGEKEIVYAK